MSTRGLKKWALLLTFWVALQLAKTKGQDQTVSGNLTVTGTTTLQGSASVQGNVDIQGNTLSLGTRTDTATTPGWAEVYIDGTTSTTAFGATRSANIWTWQENAAATSQSQMTLDNNNNLTLYDQSSPQNANIYLSPTGTSTFANPVYFYSYDNEMPNQAPIGPNSILTQGLADGRYAPLSAIGVGSVSAPNTESGFAPTLGVVGGSASGEYSFAAGNNAFAAGAFSFAAGCGVNTSGRETIALGSNNSASGYGSVALGCVSTSGGYGSAAIGYGASAGGLGCVALGSSTASGYYATAMGHLTSASGNYSTAMGVATTASAYESVVIGQANVGGGSPSTWVGTDPLFEIGNGTTSFTYATGLGQRAYHNIVPVTTSDAFVVYKNGNATVQGALTTASVYTGTITSTTGTITSSAVITAVPGGDIPMYSGE